MTAIPIEMPEQQQQQQDQLEFYNYFSSPIYHINKPEFLDRARAVFNNALKDAKKDQTLNTVYPLYHTRPLYDDSIRDLMDYIVNTSWNLLNEQGYNMDLYYINLHEFWGQSLNQHAQQTEHIHSNFSQMTGFYFLDVPKDSSFPQFFDPRQGKKQIGLFRRDEKSITMATDIVHYTPKPGDLFFINSWLGHGFSPNASKKPFNFIHFNTMAVAKPVNNTDVPPAAEII